MPPELEPARIHGYRPPVLRQRDAVVLEGTVIEPIRPGRVLLLPADQLQELEDHLNGVGSADALGRLVTGLRALD